jgi:hypothetical protein
MEIVSSINNVSILFINMDTIDFSKYKRFFAFGCSFTQYSWPTWADIIAKEINESYNYGHCAAGNFFIFQALMEAIVKHKINKDDLVMIMFSNVTREDRFTKKRGWITPGNLYSQDEYDEKFIKKYLCDHGYLMRDLNLVHGCKLALDSINCDYKFMSMVPFDSKQSDGIKMSEIDYLLKFYKTTLDIVEPSVLDIIFNGDWNTRQLRPTYHVSWQKEKYVDNHPTPQEHLIYLKNIFPNIDFSQESLNYVEDSTRLILSDQFTQHTYATDLTPRLGKDYLDLNFKWNPDLKKIKIKNE